MFEASKIIIMKYKNKLLPHDFEINRKTFGGIAFNQEDYPLICRSNNNSPS